MNEKLTSNVKQGDVPKFSDYGGCQLQGMREELDEVPIL